jgi:hypothetical protein
MTIDLVFLVHRKNPGLHPYEAQFGDLAAMNLYQCRNCSRISCSGCIEKLEREPCHADGGIITRMTQNIQESRVSNLGVSHEPSEPFPSLTCVLR